MKRNPGDDNVLLITIDSCRYDTAKLAATPILDKLGALHRCSAVATFTLPAHWAMFSGFLPVTSQSTNLIDSFKRVWRSRAARPNDDLNVHTSFDAPTIIDHYRDEGRIVLGLGGVQFFDPLCESNSLPALFPQFEYRGLRVGTGDTVKHRLTSDLPSPALDDILGEACRGVEPFFVFANLSETHFPYTTPNLPTGDFGGYEEMLRRMEVAMRMKQLGSEQTPFGDGALKAIHQLQISALEWVDSQMQAVFDRLGAQTRPTLVVVCADHGEAFGEDGRFGHGLASPPVMTVPMWVGRISGA